MTIKNVLLEIGTEEIPSRFIPDALKAIKSNVNELLNSYRLEFRDIKTYATPRRLVTIITGMSEVQSELSEILKGPPLANSYDENGEPTRAAAGFAKSKGIDVNALTEIEVNGVKYIAAEIKQESKKAIDVLPEIFTKLMSGLNFPKSMYWEKSGVRFARPVRWIVALADEKLIPFTYGSVISDRKTSGHRFMGRKTIEIANVSEFLDALYDNNVILDQEKRLQKMKTSIANLQKDFTGNLEVEMDEDILTENLYLTEYPVPFIGSFDHKYLEIPEEVLTTSMKKNQKYLAVRNKDKADKLANYFVGISNNRVPDPAVIREGNERVLRARLEDAKFFWEEDRKIPLAAYVDRLKTVTYQEKLGSVYDKVMRTRELAAYICRTYGFDAIASLVDRAAYLSKADLVTSMVFEFPELQGIMGREYAKCSGEDPRVSLAIHEQYMPQTANDNPPSDDVGAILGIAERVHIITSCHMVGLAPTGSQDPYALRRAARCINEILFARKYNFNIRDIISHSCEMNNIDDKMKEDIMTFINQRLNVQLRERGYSFELASLAGSITNCIPYQNLRYAQTIEGVISEKWFFDLTSAALRVRNILAKNSGFSSEIKIDTSIMTNEHERKLYDELMRLKDKVNEAVKSFAWPKLAEMLAELSPVIAGFFDNVMVMDDDEKIRANRLALLNECWKMMANAGDLIVLA